MMTNHVKNAVFFSGLFLGSVGLFASAPCCGNLEVSVVPNGFFQTLSSQVEKVPSSVEALRKKCDTSFAVLGSKLNEETEVLSLKVEDTGEACRRKIDDQAGCLSRLLESLDRKQEKLYLQLNSSLSRITTNIDQLSAQITHVEERITQLEEHISLQCQDIQARIRP